jgi:DNA polymerase-3 subunit epsilon
LDSVIIFDTETTDLVMPDLVPLEQQPHIVEFAGIKLDDITLEEIERLEFLVNPGIIMSDEVIGIHHITNEMVADLPGLAAHYHDLCNFFIGEATLVAHNLAFDKTMMKFELMRIGKELAFPWPHQQLCTVEASYSINNKRMHLSDLHLLATGEGFKDAHRAMADTEALVRCVRWLREQSMI